MTASAFADSTPGPPSQRRRPAAPPERLIAEFPPGWAAIVRALCAAADAHGFTVVGGKHKFAALDVVTDPWNDPVVDATVAVFQRAAAHTCEACGRCGSLATVHGWLRVLCPIHTLLLKRGLEWHVAYHSYRDRPVGQADPAGGVLPEHVLDMWDSAAFAAAFRDLVVRDQRGAAVVLRLAKKWHLKSLDQTDLAALLASNDPWIHEAALRGLAFVTVAPGAPAAESADEPTTG